MIKCLSELLRPPPRTGRTATASLACAALVAALTGCSVNFSRDLAEAVQAPKLPPPVLVESDDYKDYLAILEQPRPLLRQKDYDGLEELFNGYRQSKEAYPTTGNWKLGYLYSAITSVDRKLPDSAFERRLAELEAWRAAKPESLSAPVAIGAFYIDYAWKARGSGYADTVSQKGWRQMDERLALARKTLLEAAKEGAVCPQWWAEMMTVGLGQGWPRKVYDQVYEQAVKLEPTYAAYHSRKAYWLLPRWHGQEGDWEQFAWNMALNIGGEDGEIAYARVVLAQQEWYGDILRECPLDKEMLRRGWLALMKRHPDSLPVLSNCARITALTGDMETSRDLFERLGDQADRRVWKSAAEFHELRNEVYIATAGKTSTEEPVTVRARGPENPQDTPDPRPDQPHPITE